MTTIAYRDGAIASDSCWTDGNDYYATRMKKIDRLPNGIVVGQAGDNDGRAILELLSKITKPEEFILPKDLLETKCDCACIVIFPDKRVFVLEINDEEGKRKEAQFYQIRREFVAIGSGAGLALGAMSMGASAKKAVEVACKFDVYSRPPIHELKLKKK